MAPTEKIEYEAKCGCKRIRFTDTAGFKLDAVMPSYCDKHSARIDKLRQRLVKVQERLCVLERRVMGLEQKPVHVCDGCQVDVDLTGTPMHVEVCGACNGLVCANCCAAVDCQKAETHTPVHRHCFEQMKK